MAIERKEKVVVTKDRGFKRQDRVVEYERPAGQVFVSRLKQLIGLAVIIINILLLTRFVLRLIVANAGNAFVDFVYTVTQALSAPFQTIIANPTLNNGAVIDYGSLFALVAYSIIGWVLVLLLGILFSGSGGTRNVTSYEEQNV